MQLLLPIAVVVLGAHIAPPSKPLDLENLQKADMNQTWLCDPAGDSLPTGCPKPSDVMLRTMAPYYTPQPPVGHPGEGPGVHLYNTWGAVAAFNATRLDWVYTYNHSFVAEECPLHNIHAVSGTINGNIADSMNGSATYKIGRVLNIHGKAIGAPWMQAWANPPNYGCVNNPDYINIVHTAASAVLNTSATGLQHDDPATNGGASQWAGGNPNASGCYCDHCMSGFSDALVNGMQLNASTKLHLNITKNFNYRNYLFAHNLTDRKPPLPTENADAALLRDLFVEFQLNSSEHYVSGVRAYVQTEKPGTPLSCNNGGRWTTPYHLCDFGMGELNIRDANPGSLEYIFHTSVPAGRVQVMTMPKAANITTADTSLVRWSIATAYALGAHIIVPWDIYLPTPQAIRYYGTAAQYGDLYSFVRSKSTEYFDNTTFMNNSHGTSSSFKLVHTGADGDGIRFELPNESTHPSNGTCQAKKVDVDGCQWLCLEDSKCVAIYSSPSASGECCLLYEPLVTIAHTSLVGDSYIRQDTNGSVTPPSFSSNISTLKLYPRHKVDGGIVVHAVDWGYTSASNNAHVANSSTTTTMVTMTVQNKVLEKNCVAGHATIAIDGPGMAPEPDVVHVACNNKDASPTSFSIPLPLPWIVIEIRSIGVSSVN